MNRSTLTACVLLSVLTGACGAEPAPEALEPLAEVSQEATFPPMCTLKYDYMVRYYSDSTKTTQIGSATCGCGYLYVEGNSSSYYTYQTAVNCTWP